MEDRRIEVADMDGILDDVVAEPVLRAAKRKPNQANNPRAPISRRFQRPVPAILVMDVLAMPVVELSNRATSTFA